jgi:nitrosocyanin
MLNKKMLAVLTLVLLTGAGCTAATTDEANLNTGSEDTSEITIDSGAAGTMEAGSGSEITNDLVGGDAEVGAETADVKEFTVTGGNFVFEPAVMTVKKGDLVKVTFKNDEGFHDFVIDEFAAATKQIQAGTEETIEFVADEVGSFEYYCSVGKHREMGMKGTLTVTE